MEDHSGFKRVLSFPWAYVFFQNLVGSHKGNKWIAENIWCVSPGQKIIDIGCGPGTVLDYLPQDIEYVGFDISEPYIDNARRKYRCKHNVFFFVSSVSNILENHNPLLNDADIVLCNGLLHHLNDAEALEVFRLAKRLLKPRGCLICAEPVFLIHQSAFSRWLMQKDRGQHIRTESQWKDLIKKAFDSFTTNICINLIRIPYVYIFIKGHVGSG